MTTEEVRRRIMGGRVTTRDGRHEGNGPPDQWRGTIADMRGELGHGMCIRVACDYGVNRISGPSLVLHYSSLLRQTYKAMTREIDQCTPDVPIVGRSLVGI